MQLDEAFKALGFEGRKIEAQVIADHISTLRIVCDEKKWELPLEMEKEVEHVWREHLKSHPNDFDGSLMSLEKISVLDGKVYLLGRTTKFSVFFATRHLCRGKRLNISSARSIDYSYPVPISFGMVTKTLPTKYHPNGCIVAAFRGDTAFDCQKATFLPSGYFDPQEDCKLISGLKMIPIEQVILRELKEELPGISSWVSPPKLLAIVHSLTESCQPAIIGWMEIPFTAEEVMSLYGNTVSHEVRQIVCIPADIESLRNFAKEHELCVHDAYKIALFVADTM